MTTLYDDGIRKVLERHHDDRRGLPRRQEDGVSVGWMRAIA